MVLVPIRPRPGKGLHTPRMHSTPRTHTHLQGPLWLAPPHSPAQSQSQSRSSDSHLMLWFSLSGAWLPKHRLPTWPLGFSSDELTGTPGTRHLPSAVAGGRGRRRNRRREMRQHFRRLSSPALLPLSAHRLPPSPPTQHSPSPGHWAPFSSCPESRRQTGSCRCRAYPPSKTILKILPTPSQPEITLPSLGTGLGAPPRLHTFLVSEGRESCDGCLGWLGFWACLLQARGFDGSPKDLQNSTCRGKRAGFHSC